MTRNNGAYRTVPHAQPLSGVRTPEEGRKLMRLIQHPLPLVRAAGDLAYETGEDSPYLDQPDSPEALNWNAGYRDARQRNS